MGVTSTKRLRYLIIPALVCVWSLSAVSAPLSAGVMREMTSMELVKDMLVGWNLGNTLDANGKGLGAETAWGNPKTTKAMMDAVKAKGFRTVRIPVTWNRHIGDAPEYTIDSAWLARVEEVVNYVLDNGMYAILNSHHDEWVTLYDSTKAEVTDKLTRVWAQIAARFRDCSDYLVFETLNEPRLYGTRYEWNGGNEEGRSILNAYNLAVVNTIRESGGNNALRHIMIPTHAASTVEAAQDDLVIPPGDDRIIVSQHTYWPYSFTMEDPGTDTWGTEEDKSDCDDELDRIYNRFCARGIPVIIGEWGTINKANTPARAVHAEYYTKAVVQRGMLPVWWDNGDPQEAGFALLNRSDGTWYFPEIVDALMDGAGIEVGIVRRKPEARCDFMTDRRSISVEMRRFQNVSPAAMLFSLDGRRVFDPQNFNGNLRSAPVPGYYVLRFATSGTHRCVHGLR